MTSSRHQSAGASLTTSTTYLPTYNQRANPAGGLLAVRMYITTFTRLPYLFLSTRLSSSFFSAHNFGHTKLFTNCLVKSE